jgi:hypothetical protein
MRANAWVLVVCMALSIGAVASARQRAAPPGGSAPKAKTPVAAAGSPYRTVATIQEIMGGMIDPASKVVFNAVSSTTNEKGVEQKVEPKNDEDWAVVRRNALMMIEGANLIMMPGRRVARSGQVAPPAVEGELAPKEVEVLLAKDRRAWNRFATEFIAAASAALKAADTKDAAAVFASGEGVDAACENCHLRYWYPDQDKLFQKKPAR